MKKNLFALPITLFFTVTCAIALTARTAFAAGSGVPPSRLSAQASRQVIVKAKKENKKKKMKAVKKIKKRKTLTIASPAALAPAAQAATIVQ